MAPSVRDTGPIETSDRGENLIDQIGARAWEGRDPCLLLLLRSRLASAPELLLDDPDEGLQRLRSCERSAIDEEGRRAIEAKPGALVDVPLHRRCVDAARQAALERHEVEPNLPGSSGPDSPVPRWAARRRAGRGTPRTSPGRGRSAPPRPRAGPGGGGCRWGSRGRRASPCPDTAPGAAPASAGPACRTGSGSRRTRRASPARRPRRGPAPRRSAPRPGRSEAAGAGPQSWPATGVPPRTSLAARRASAAGGECGSARGR